MAIRIQLECRSESETLEALRKRASGLGSKFELVDGAGGDVLAAYEREEEGELYDPEPGEGAYSPGFVAKWQSGDVSIHVAVSRIEGAVVSAAVLDGEGRLVAGEPSMELDLPPDALLSFTGAKKLEGESLDAAVTLLKTLRLNVSNPDTGAQYQGSVLDGLLAHFAAGETKAADKAATRLDTGYVAPPQFPAEWQTEFVLADQDMEWIDYDPATGRWAGVPSRDGSYVVVDGKPFALPFRFTCPGVRLLPDGVFVYETRSDSRDSAALLDSAGNVVRVLDIGDGAGYVTVLDDYIVVGYIDEGIAMGNELSNEGLIALDMCGEVAFRYSDIPGAEYEWPEIEAFVKIGPNIVAGLPWGDPMVVIDIAKRELAVVELPDKPYGWNAIAKRGDEWLLHGAHDTEAIFSWSEGDMSFAKIARHPGWLHGTPDGQFMAIGKRGVTMIEVR